MRNLSWLGALEVMVLGAMLAWMICL